jgi:hypothetical protein
MFPNEHIDRFGGLEHVVTAYQTVFSAPFKYPISTLKEKAAQFKYLNEHWLPVIKHIGTWNPLSKEYVEDIEGVFSELNKTINDWESAQQFQTLRDKLLKVYENRTEFTEGEKEICELNKVLNGMHIPVETKFKTEKHNLETDDISDFSDSFSELSDSSDMPPLEECELDESGE